MIIVLILVVLWGVVLGPSIYRKIRSSSSDRSITSFHRSLDFLERSGPKVVAPAYRLAGTESLPLVPTIVRPQPLPKVSQPSLVLLGPQGQSGEDQMSERYNDYYDEGGYEHQDDAYFSAYEEEYVDQRDRQLDFGPSFSSVTLNRREAARRRRNILFGLIGAVVLTAILGFFMSFFFYLTVISFVSLVGYVGLMAYAAKSGMFGEKGYERHVAHGIAPLGQERYEDHYQEPVYSKGNARDGYFNDDDLNGDRWWDQPQQVVAR